MDVTATSSIDELRKFIDQHGLPVKKNVGGAGSRTKTDIYNDVVREWRARQTTSSSTATFGLATPAPSPAASPVRPSAPSSPAATPASTAPARKLFDDATTTGTAAGNAAEGGDGHDWLNSGDAALDAVLRAVAAPTATTLRDGKALSDAPTERAVEDAIEAYLHKHGGLGKDVKLTNVQRDTVRLMLRNELPDHICSGGILADSMGLGKTLSTLCLMRMLRRPGGTLVVLKNENLISGWQRDIASFFEPGTFAQIKYHGNKKPKHLDAQPANGVVFTTYGTLISPKSRATLTALPWHRIVLDEAHGIKNPKTKSHQTCVALRARVRWCVTGSPLENRVEDIHSLWNFLRFDVHVFAKAVGKPATGDDVEMTALKLTIIRHAKASVENANVPEKIVLHMPIAYGQPDQARLSAIAEASSNHPLARMTAARMAVSGALPKSLLSNPDELLKPVLTKVQAVMWRVRKIILQGRLTEEVMALPDLGTPRLPKGYSPAQPSTLLPIMWNASRKPQIVIMCAFQQVLNAFAAQLKEDGIAFSRRDGAEYAGKRGDDEIRAFQDRKTQVLLVAFQAGGAGINLQNANIMFIVDRWFNDSKEEQAMDRIVRLHSEHTKAYVYLLQGEDAVERRMQKLRDGKAELTDRFVDSLQTVQDKALHYTVRTDMLSPPSDAFAIAVPAGSAGAKVAGAVEFAMELDADEDEDADPDYDPAADAAAEEDDD